MFGAILNAAGILAGSLIGWLWPRNFAPATESFLKFGIGLFTVFHGLRLAWMSCSGTLGQALKLFGIGLLAMMLGRWLGRLVRLQKASNAAGQYARQLMEQTAPGSPDRFSNGLTLCSILFCASPLGILGAIQAGLPAGPGGGGYYYPLGIKAVMDGLAMIGFVRMFGIGAALAALPVLVFLSVISLGTIVYIEPVLRNHGLIDAVNMVGGLLLTVMSLVMFEVKKVELADYLPSLAVAPLLAWLFT